MDGHQPVADHLERERFAALRSHLFYPKSDLPIISCPSNACPLEQVAASLRAICERHFRCFPEAISPVGEPGTFHRLFRLDLPDSRSVIARLNALSDQFRDRPLLLDRWASARLHAAGLPALEVYAVDLSRRDCPWDYELLEPAQGVPLKQFDNDETALAPLLTELGAFLARVHRLSTEHFGLLIPDATGSEARGACSTWAGYLENHLERHVALCKNIQAISSREAQAILKVFREATVRLETRPALLHGDPGSHNVFVEGDRVSTLIDWEDALAGDPIYEVAFWATFHPEPRHAAFLEGYRREQDLGKNFAYRFWLYFLRVALAKTVVRHNLGLRDRPGRPPASLRIQRGLQGVAEARLAA
jgi:aminoglycoside phosphotransferase (APT) family kinase protein